MKRIMTVLIGLSIATVLQSQQRRTHFVLDNSGNPIKNTDLKSSVVPKSNSSCRVFFSPKDDVRSQLLSLISNEKKSIKVSIFMFTDKEIAHALINAAKHGIEVTVIVDGVNSTDRFSKIDMLKRSGINVLEYRPQSTAGISNDIMHHKFVIFGSNENDCSLLWTGSCNFTRSASTRNQENVIVLDDTHVIQQFEQEFERLKQVIQKTTFNKSQSKKITILNRKNIRNSMC